MPTAADLNELMDRLSRSDDGFVALGQGYELYRAVYEEGLVAHRDMATVGRWLGELVRDGRVSFRTHAGGSPEPPPGVTWGERELQDHYDYFLTADGRADAREARRLRQDRAAEETLAGVVGPQT